MPARRATSAALALITALALGACAEADNGNNTLADDQKSGAPSSAPGAPQSTAPAAPGGDPGSRGGGAAIEVEAKDMEFAPKDLTAKAGTITIVMDNTGKAPHTWTQKDLGVDVNADPGKKVEFEIKDAKPGKYHYVCTYHESIGMVGDITVT